MKALLIIALFAAVASAIYTPRFTEKLYNPDFSVSNVVSYTKAIAGQNNIINVCGVAQNDFSVSQYTWTIPQNGGKTQGIVTVPPSNIYSETKYCYFFNFQVPTNAYGSFNVTLTLQNTNPARNLSSIDVQLFF